MAPRSAREADAPQDGPDGSLAGRCTPGLVQAITVLVLLVCLAPGASGQTVAGVVVETESGTALSGVGLLLRTADGTPVARAESADDGSFLLSAPRAGDYSLEASRLDYASPPPLELTLGPEVVEVEVRMSRSPLELEPISITQRRRDPRHDATFQGALVRHSQLPGVGGRRVVLREDPEMASAIRIRDVLRWFPPGRGCTIIYWDGRVQRDSLLVDEWLESSTGHFEAVEFYRWFLDAPRGLQRVPPYVQEPAGCSVVALWSRLPDEHSTTHVWRRTAAAVGVGAGLWFLGRALVGR
jgi:hypothetical protein